MQKEFIVSDSAETQALASRFAAALAAGSVVGLVGDLGAGKTTFVQGMAVGLNIDPEAYVTSPTFALIHEYVRAGAADKAPTLVHFDLYRLTHFEELLHIGFEDYIQTDAVCVIEWVDRFPELVAYLTHRVEIDILKGRERKISIEGDFQWDLGKWATASSPTS